MRWNDYQKQNHSVNPPLQQNHLFRCSPPVFINKIIKDDSINKGDVVAYKYENKIIVHRVVSKECKKNKCYYQTKGDANNVRDEGVLTIDDIKGKVLFKIVYVAYPSVWVSEWLGMN